MALDHGQLNLPLHKRCNIHAEIDRLKAQKRQEEKERAKEHAAKVVEAKAFLATMPEEQLTRIAKKAGLTIIQARKKLNSIAHWTPDNVLRLKASALPKT